MLKLLKRSTSMILIFALAIAMLNIGLVVPVYAAGTALPIYVDGTINNFAGLVTNSNGNTLLESTGNTIVDGSNNLQLTDNGGSKVGTVVRRSPIKLNSGFSTYFVANMSSLQNNGGDGLCFIVYDSKNGVQSGGTGINLGYSDYDKAGKIISGDSIAVELDTCCNDQYEGLLAKAGQNYRHIAIDTNDWDGSRPNNTPTQDSRFSTSAPGANILHSGYCDTTSNSYSSITDDSTQRTAHGYSNLNNGSDVNVWADLTNNGDGTSEVIVTYGPSHTRTDSTNYSFKRKLSNQNLLNDSVYVGFSASTGSATEYHNIKSWYFSNAPIEGGIDPTGDYTQAASGINVDTQNGSGSSSINPTHAIIQIKKADGANMTTAQNVIVSVDGGSLSTIMTDANGTLDFDLSGLSPASHTIAVETADGSAQSSKTFTVTSMVKLSTPDNVAVTSGGAVSWGNSDSNASSFTVKVYKAGAGVPIKTINNAISGATSLSPTDYISSGTGNYDVTVTAVGDNTSYSNSTESTKTQNMSVHSVSLTITGGNGTDSVQVGSGSAVTTATSVPYYYFGGANITITAIPASSRNVTWQDNSTSSTYTITSLSKDEAITATFTAPISADLGNIVLSGSPAGFTFSGNTYTYSGVTVANGVSGITVTPTGAGTITVNGTPVTSGQASGAIELTAGVQKTITVVITETDKSSKTYTLHVTREILNAPTAPTIESANAGDEHVTITWNNASGATGYKIFMSTTSGSYGTALATVGDYVYSYDAAELTNGVTYYFAVKATNGGGDSNYSNEVSATPQAAIPGAPVLQSANAGDKHVNISWSGATGSTGYKIYISTTSGSYTTPATTVTEAVYSCDVSDLTNGITYYFVVKAANASGDSAYSNEISATPKTVPGAPTNVTSTAGNGEAAVSFTAPADNGGSTITGYTVTSNPGNKIAIGTSGPITVTGLTNGITYTFTVTATNAAGTGVPSAASNAVTPHTPSGGGNSTTTQPTTQPPENTGVDSLDKGKAEDAGTTTQPTNQPPENTGVDILVNGKTENAGTTTTATEGNKTVTTIAIDEQKLEQKLEAEGSNAVVTIPVNTKADIVVGKLNGQIVKNMENKQAVLEVKTENETYTLPSQQINISAISEQIGSGVELKDIQVQVEIAKGTPEEIQLVENSAKHGEFTIIAPPVEFSVKCTYEDKTVEVSSFNAYVERTIAIPDGIDPSKITTGVIVDPDGTTRHVPTRVTVINGKYYAVINSLTNSLYSVVWHPLEFKDAANHWAKEAINDMGSRMVISGVGSNMFEPNRDITRAEFAAIIVRALGLKPGTGNNKFADVNSSDWYCDYIKTAAEYKIISGYGDGKFGPNDKITREQAMTMIARAMNITGLKVQFANGEIDKLLVCFGDAAKSADYARASIAACVKTGIISGRNGKLIAPKENITRAEVAVIVQRLLQKSNLI